MGNTGRAGEGRLSRLAFNAPKLGQSDCGEDIKDNEQC
jgi:hypothetical protein